MSSPSTLRAVPAPSAGPEPPGEARLRELAAKKVAPLRRPGRWVAAAVVLVLLTQLAHALITNPVFQWNVFGYWFFRPVILDGLLLTLELTGLAAVFGLVVGIVLALLRLSKKPLLQAVSWAYVWIFSSIPLIVLLLFLANVTALYSTLSLGIPFGPSFFSFSTTDVLSFLSSRCSA